MKKQYLVVLGLCVLFILLISLIVYFFSLTNNIYNNSVTDNDLNSAIDVPKKAEIDLNFDVNKETLLVYGEYVEDMQMNDTDYAVKQYCYGRIKEKGLMEEEGRVYAMLSYISLSKLFKQENYVTESNTYHEKFLTEYELFKTDLEKDSEFVKYHLYELDKIVKQLEPIDTEQEKVDHLKEVINKHIQPASETLFSTKNFSSNNMKENDLTATELFQYEMTPSSKLVKSVVAMTEYHDIDAGHSITLEITKQKIRELYKTEKSKACIDLLLDLKLYEISGNEKYLEEINQFVNDERKINEWTIVRKELSVLDWKCGDVLYETEHNQEKLKKLLKKLQIVYPDTCSYDLKTGNGRWGLRDYSSLQKLAEFLYLYSNM